MGAWSRKARRCGVERMMCAGGVEVEDGGGLRERGVEGGGFARAMAQKGQVGFVVEGEVEEEGI